MILFVTVSVVVLNTLIKVTLQDLQMVNNDFIYLDNAVGVFASVNTLQSAVTQVKCATRYV